MLTIEYVSDEYKSRTAEDAVSIIADHFSHLLWRWHEPRYDRTNDRYCVATAKKRRWFQDPITYRLYLYLDASDLSSVRRIQVEEVK